MGTPESSKARQPQDSRARELQEPEARLQEPESHQEPARPESSRSPKPPATSTAPAVPAVPEPGLRALRHGYGCPVARRRRVVRELTVAARRAFPPYS